ncbi:MAG: short-chain dehydrogenase [Nocardioidaceae bacterium]|nr:short-chain dehydrogenase [Nocardioidaceae bacterium]
MLPLSVTPVNAEGMSTTPPARAAAPGVALVTGGTSGIGLEFAHQLAARGHDLVLVARDQTRLRAVAEELSRTHGVAVDVLVADLVDRAQLATVEARLQATERPVRLLVNNGGYGLKHDFLDNTVDDEQAHLDVHVVAVMRLTHAALGAMLAHGGGAVINVASVSAFLPRGSYGAAKAYVVNLSRWADLKYAATGVRVMALAPGFVKTEFHGRMDVDRGRAPGLLWLDADRVVREALADLDAGKSLSVPTKRYKAIVGAARLVPQGVLARFSSMGRGD